MKTNLFFFKIFDYSKQRNIPFILTPHAESVLPVIEKINPPFIKIGSGELGNFDFLDKVKLLNKEIVVSTGMHNKKDIEKLVTYFHDYSPSFCHAALYDFLPYFSSLKKPKSY